jgi:hypothetical protein
MPSGLMVRIRHLLLLIYNPHSHQNLLSTAVCLGITEHDYIQLNTPSLRPQYTLQFRNMQTLTVAAGSD